MIEDDYIDLVRRSSTEPLSPHFDEPGGSELSIVLLEGRDLPLLKFNLWNIANVYGCVPGVGLTIMCSDENVESLKTYTASWENVRITVTDNLSSWNTYNDLLCSTEFYDMFNPKGHILICQWDTYIFKQVPNFMFGYDYIGAPWNHTYAFREGTGMIMQCGPGCKCTSCEDPDRLLPAILSTDKIFKVGNGGFSLRKVSSCRRQCMEVEHVPGSAEDMFFSISTNLKIPPVDVASEFSVEHLSHLSPVGCHQIWKFQEDDYIRRLFKKPTNVLITGVAGLIGSNLAHHLITSKKYKVTGIDNLSGGYIENVHPDVKFHKLDLASDYDKIDALFRDEHFDVVYHLAAYAAEGLSPFIRKFNYTNNLISTTNIVNCCITYDVTRLVFTSSMAVYGAGKVPFDEEKTVCNPVDPYGVAKLACEMDIKIAGDHHGLDWCIIRPHNVYGKNQNIWDMYRNVIGIWMYKHLLNKPLVVVGDGKQTRAFTYIDDIMEPLERAGMDEKASRCIINLGGSQEYSINDAARTVVDVMGDLQTKIDHVEARHEVKHAHSTWKKSEEILGFKHSTSLKEGVSKMWTWAKAQPPRDVFKWGEYEINKGMYEYWK